MKIEKWKVQEILNSACKEVNCSSLGQGVASGLEDFESMKMEGAYNYFARLCLDLGSITKR